MLKHFITVAMKVQSHLSSIRLLDAISNRKNLSVLELSTRLSDVFTWAMSQEDFPYLEDKKPVLVEGQQALQLVFPICLPLHFVSLFLGAWHPFVKVP